MERERGRKRERKREREREREEGRERKEGRERQRERESIVNGWECDEGQAPQAITRCHAHSSVTDSK